MGSVTEQLLLLDSASLYFRAFFGVPAREGTGPIPTNAIRGFTDMIATLVHDWKPTRLVACWDNDWRPAFRVAAIPSYKTHRLTEGSDVQEESPPELTPQVPIIVELLAAIGICRVGCDGYEADDVIGTLATAADGGVDVVTGDRDLFQLVDDAAGIRVLYTVNGGVRNPEVVTQSVLSDRYGVSTGQQYADLATLRGDSSDGLPGIRGIGEKTATRLIQRYGDLATLRSALADGDPAFTPAQRARLEEGAAYLDVAPTVVQVARDAPLPTPLDAALPTRVADEAALDRLVQTHGLHTPVRRLREVLGI